MILIPSAKTSYKKQRVEILPDPPVFYMPLNAYKGALTPVVTFGDAVIKYQLLARSEGAFGAAIHAPVSGRVGELVTRDGDTFLTLINDFAGTEMPVQPTVVAGLSNDDIISRIREYGVEGSGGARFPTALKYAIGAHAVNTFIINGAECEPFLTADYAVMYHYADQLMVAAKLVQQLVQAAELVVAIERHNKELSAILEAAFKKAGLQGRVQLLPNEYPQGGELQLIQSVTGKFLPKGAIPVQHGVIVSNTGTLWAIYKAFYEGRPYVERMVTLYSESLKKGGNYLVKIGTPVAHIMDAFAGEGKDISTRTSLILGGPMMGKQVTDEQQSLHKGAAGLLQLYKPSANVNNCIACGYCVDACPQRLLPMEFARFFLSNEPARLQDYHLADCIECGACAYACPSDVPLMASIREGKNLLSQLS